MENFPRSIETFCDFSRLLKNRFPILLLSILFLGSVHAQKNRGWWWPKKEKIVVRSCIVDLGNGIHRANFGYENQEKKDIWVSQDDSYVKSNMHDKRMKGTVHFKRGLVKKAFAQHFGPKEVVEWVVITPRGKVLKIYASANSSKCRPEEQKSIGPVYAGDGKEPTLIGSKLTSLNQGNAGDNPSELIFQIEGERVLIEIVPKDGRTADVINMLQSVYGVVTGDFVIPPAVILSENLTAIDVSFPIADLDLLNQETEDINFVRPLYPTIKNVGVVTTQGDSVQRTSIIRDAYRVVKDGEIKPVDGTGVKHGVISDSYNTTPTTGLSQAEIDVINGDLPGTDNPNGYLTPVEVRKESDQVATDEGRAMLQIIHDVSPGSELAFYSGVASPRALELGIKDLQSIGCDIITDDLTFPTESFFNKGKVPQFQFDFAALPGRAYFTSAGNFGDAAFQGVFQPATESVTTNFLAESAVVNVFGSNADGSEDTMLRISVEEGVYFAVLQWDEPPATADNASGAFSDLDIYVTDDDGNLLVGNNRINEAGDPTEIIVFQATAQDEANFMITSANGAPTAGLPFRCVIFQADGLTLEEYGGAPTVTGQAMTPAANTVGSINFFNAESLELPSYSSFGGMLPDGTNVEIDFLAPDGGNVNLPFFSEDSSVDEDSFPNFFGTSAAAPHAAGTYGLFLSVAESWYPEGLPIEVPVLTNLLADKMLGLMKQFATPVSDANRGGSGLLNLERVFDEIAAKTPQITSLVIEDGKAPSSEPFELTILGKYFPQSSKVIFEEQEMEIISVSENEIVAVIPEFTGNPKVFVKGETITPVGAEAAIGEGKSILPEGTRALNVSVADVSIKYGQSFDFEVTVDGLEEGETLETIGLPAVIFESAAVFPYPDVNNYVIFPKFETPLTEEQQASYVVNFKNGLLEVTKNELTIRPPDITATYGERIDPSQLIYEVDPEGIEDLDDFLNLIRTSHSADFFDENTLIILNRLRAVVNQEEILDLLENRSWMTSENTIINRLRAVVNQMNVIDLEPKDFENFLNQEEDPITNRLRAVVNRLRAVVNAKDLLDGIIDLEIENRLRAVVNTSGLGDEGDNKDYSSIFAVVDAEDATDDQGEGGVDVLYAMNLLTGLEVTPTLEDRHYIYPGAFLAPIAANFNVSVQSSRAEILPADLTVSTGDLLIKQNMDIDSSAIALSIEGFVYEETRDSIFPEGVVFRFVDSNGVEYQKGDSGVFDILIQDPENYTVNYESVGKLMVNPFGDHVRKIRIYLDCVEEDHDATGALKYTANFRYKNPNSETIFIPDGHDNYLYGNGQFEGNLPTVFLPGEGTFSVKFDGHKLIWVLKSYYKHWKKTQYAIASKYSWRCYSSYYDDEDSPIDMYPNPVSDFLTIERKTNSSGTLEIYNVYGQQFESIPFNESTGLTFQVDMSSYPEGVYIVRVISDGHVFTFNVLKD